VKVSAAEVTAIAGFLGMEEQAFVDGYTRLRADRQGLSIIDREDHSCIFLEGGGWVINAVKPQQCRDFPNKWNFPGWRQVCEAVPVEVGRGERYADGHRVGGTGGEETGEGD
jgi:Fe-S-cluster containining protein